MNNTYIGFSDDIDIKPNVVSADVQYGVGNGMFETIKINNSVKITQYKSTQGPTLIKATIGDDLYVHFEIGNKCALTRGDEVILCNYTIVKSSEDTLLDSIVAIPYTDNQFIIINPYSPIINLTDKTTSLLFTKCDAMGNILKLRRLLSSIQDLKNCRTIVEMLIHMCDTVLSDDDIGDNVDKSIINIFANNYYVYRNTTKFRFVVYEKRIHLIHESEDIGFMIELDRNIQRVFFTNKDIFVPISNKKEWMDVLADFNTVYELLFKKADKDLYYESATREEVFRVGKSLTIHDNNVYSNSYVLYIDYGTTYHKSYKIDVSHFSTYAVDVTGKFHYDRNCVDIMSCDKDEMQIYDLNKFAIRKSKGDTKCGYALYALEYFDDVVGALEHKINSTVTSNSVSTKSVLRPGSEKLYIDNGTEDKIPVTFNIPDSNKMEAVRFDNLMKEVNEIMTSGVYR